MAKIQILASHRHEGSQCDLRQVSDVSKDPFPLGKHHLSLNGCEA